MLFIPFLVGFGAFEVKNPRPGPKHSLTSNIWRDLVLLALLRIKITEDILRGGL
jgi:hypothetical protein